MSREGAKTSTSTSQPHPLLGSLACFSRLCTARLLLDVMQMLEARGWGTARKWREASGVGRRREREGRADVRKKSHGVRHLATDRHLGALHYCFPLFCALLLSLSYFSLFSPFFSPAFLSRFCYSSFPVPRLLLLSLDPLLSSGAPPLCPFCFPHSALSFSLSSPPRLLSPYLPLLMLVVAHAHVCRATYRCLCVMRSMLPLRR